MTILSLTANFCFTHSSTIPRLTRAARIWFTHLWIIRSLTQASRIFVLITHSPELHSHIANLCFIHSLTIPSLTRAVRNFVLLTYQLSQASLGLHESDILTYGSSRASLAQSESLFSLRILLYRKILLQNIFAHLVPSNYELFEIYLWLDFLLKEITEK